jgi:protein tyrosine/serine phosphatase
MIVLLGECLLGTACARGLPVQEEILNFGKVNEHLYRGAQPDAAGMKSLKKLGVKLIVNLRLPGDSWKVEEAQATANGILYTNFPMTGRGTPEDQQVRKILSLFESFPDPIFIHCQHGCDRTGTVVACYRIQHDRWSSQLAMREARHYGISFWEFRMKRYVAAFARPDKPHSGPDLREARSN